MKYVDLSHEITGEMPNYPGDKKVDILKEKDYKKAGYNSYSFCGNMHVGTHIDAPLHMKKEGKYISDYPVERFIGNVVLLDVRGESTIEIKDEHYSMIKENDIVLLFTGWDQYYGTDEYYSNHPVISEELAEILVRKKIKMVGVDMPSPDNEPYNIHKKFFENDIFILENLTNLKTLLYNENIKLFAQPLNIKAEGSLVRAIASYEGY